jgi:hypothetical protein
MSAYRPSTLAPAAVAFAATLVGLGVFALVGGDSHEDGAIVTLRASAPPRLPLAAPGPAATGRRAPNDGVHAGVAAAGGEGAGAALPSGHPPVGGGAPAGAGGAAADPDDGHPDLPVRARGINSREELERGRARAASAEARDAFERGFRLAFTTRKERRDYAGAERLLARAVELDAGLAEAYRALGYARFNTGGGFEGAIPLYRKAVEIDADYGEAHYALAFFLGETDRASGRTHFRRAMQLGVPDERGLRGRYYADVTD